VNKAEKEKAAKLAIIAATLKTATENMTDEEKKALKAKILGGKDEELKAAINSIPDLSYYGDSTPDDSTNRSSIEGDGKTLKAMQKENEKLNARMAAMETELQASKKTQADEFIDQMTSFKATIIPGLDKGAYKAKLADIPFEGLKAMYEERVDEIGAMKAASVRQSGTAFEFPSYGSSQPEGEFTSANDILGGTS
jgi:hypothetical protein